MNFLDLFLLIPVAFGLYSGYSKGLIQQLTGLLAILATFYFGFKGSKWVTQFLVENNCVNEQWSAIVGIVITIIGFSILLKLVGSILKKFTKTIGLGFLEQLGGGIFGGLKAYIIVLVLLFFLLKIDNILPFFSEENRAQSKVFPFYELGIDYLTTWWKTSKT